MNYNIKNELELYKNPITINYKHSSTGHSVLDNCLTINGSGDCGFKTSRLYTILGCTGSGKSLFMLNIAKMLSNQDKNILYISLENTEDQTLERLQSSGLEPDKSLYLSHPTKDPNFGLNDSFYASDVEVEINKVQEKYNVEIEIVILDYLGEITPTSGKNSYEEFGNIAKELKELAKKKNICIITASQCNRDALSMYKKANTIEDKLEALTDISEANVSDSIKIIHVSDFVLFVHRIPSLKLDGYRKGIPHPALFISVLKNRDYSSKMEKVIIPYETQHNRLSKYGVDLT